MENNKYRCRRADKNNEQPCEMHITGQLATLNEHDGANRLNKYAGASFKKEMTELVRVQCLNKKQLKNPVKIYFEWFYSSKHDFDNIAFAKKYVLDGLVHAGVLPNDNQTWVKGFCDEFTKVQKGEEGVLVEFKKIKRI